MSFISVYSCVDRWVGRLLPPRCVLCNRAGAERGFDLCGDCQRELPWIERGCPRCGLPGTPGEFADAVRSNGLPIGCTQCRDLELPYGFCYAPCLYQFPVARLIQALKYEGALANGRVLGTLLARAALRAGCVCRHAGDSGPAGAGAVPDRRGLDAVVPMPLHAARLVERGYNQSYEIARFAAAELGLPCLPQSLRRVRGTRPQVGLTREQRVANVRGAFAALPRDIAGRRIVLLDDVVTTGSTVAAAAHSLIEAGARSVAVWCVARAQG